MEDCFSEGGTAFAIVSPCSVCKNQRSTSDDGLPFCPRRKWQEDMKLNQQDENGNADPRVIPLAAYGTEGTPAEGDKSLRNPVYLDTSKTTLVWIAALRDNCGVSDENGVLLAPSILDPSFIPDSTDHIQCRKVPYVIAQQESAYRQSGALKEGDCVFAITANAQQHNIVTTQINDGIEPDNSSMVYEPLLIEGVVMKTDKMYFVPRAPIEVDYTTEGT